MGLFGFFAERHRGRPGDPRTRAQAPNGERRRSEARRARRRRAPLPVPLAEERSQDAVPAEQPGGCGFQNNGARADSFRPDRVRDDHLIRRLGVPAGIALGERRLGSVRQRRIGVAVAVAVAPGVSRRFTLLRRRRGRVRREDRRIRARRRDVPLRRRRRPSQGYPLGRRFGFCVAVPRDAKRQEQSERRDERDEHGGIVHGHRAHRRLRRVLRRARVQRWRVGLLRDEDHLLRRRIPGREHRGEQANNRGGDGVQTFVHGSRKEKVQRGRRG